MANQLHAPRKRRTRQHVIADLSVHHVEGFILEEGHTAQRFGSDYGYDLVMRTFDEDGYIEPDGAHFQLKATETLHEVGSDYTFDLDIRDYNLWIEEELPVFLVLFDASLREAYWLAVQPYFEADVSRRPKKDAKTIRIRVPNDQRVDRQAVQAFRAIIAERRRLRLRIFR